MATEYEAKLDGAKRRLVKIFGKSIAHEIFRYSESIIETEKYVMFTKYVRKIVIDYLHAYLLNLVCDLWEKDQNNLDESFKADPLKYIQKNALGLQIKLYNTALYLVGKRLVFDYMSTNNIEQILVQFFSDIDIGQKVYKNVKSLAVFKSHFTESMDNATKIKANLEGKKEVLEVMLKTYLTIKENLYKNLGYDVTLEYNNIRDFSFVYNDPRLNTKDEKPMVIEYEVIQSVVKVLDPEGDGDVMLFLKKIRPEEYGYTG